MTVAYTTDTAAKLRRLADAIAALAQEQPTDDGTAAAVSIATTEAAETLAAALTDLEALFLSCDLDHAAGYFGAAARILQNVPE